MLSEEEKNQASSPTWKTFSRSMTWTERPPRKANSKPQWNSKARACLPPLQPLSITRPSAEEWPRAGSDDLGVWPNPPTPGARPKSLTPRENSSSSSEQPPREFEFRKDMLAFFEHECSRIVDHIYLGSDAIAKNREVLRKNKITHVLNCVGFVCPEYFKNELVYKTLWLQDSPSEDITSILYDVFDYFEDVREKSGRVLVHCFQGVSRSTSLVIAYLMWKEGQSFDDAFQHVKVARGVTNPNVGFACQLLQCQKRVHALPASPTSVLRMYRMAPHSPYDPLHLVPKMLPEASSGRLDSRGAFIVQIPSALYVWIGRGCSSVMSDNARSAAGQVVRYERVRGPIVIVKEGEETFEFWDILGSKESISSSFLGEKKKVEEYDLDFEIFQRALAGGVVPPFPVSEAGPETCLPARENGWNGLRRKSDLKEFDNLKEVVGFNKGPILGTSISRSRSFSLVDSFSSFCVGEGKSSSKSPVISPSTSDSSSSLTISPSSSNWSGSSSVSVSAQPSPCGVETRDIDPSKSSLLEETSQISKNSTRFLESSENNREEPVLDEKNCNAFNVITSHDDMTSRIAEETNLVVYEWPSMHKLDVVNCGILDSRCVYIIIIPACVKTADALYVWIGRDSSSSADTDMEIVSRNLLIKEGFSSDAQIKVVKEGEEPVKLLEHLGRFSIDKSRDGI